uniref:Uncharacterized protein n=1 Tax=Anguilla anguilla TaxID=7936 RepID=A0A0E9X0F7_ANGAN
MVSGLHSPSVLRCELWCKEFQLFTAILKCQYIHIVNAGNTPIKVKCLSLYLCCTKVFIQIEILFKSDVIQMHNSIMYDCSVSA